MKFIIEDAQNSYICDFDKPIPDEDETKDKFPDVDEAIDAFLRLLENIYSAEKDLIVLPFLFQDTKKPRSTGSEAYL